MKKIILLILFINSITHLFSQQMQQIPVSSLLRSDFVYSYSVGNEEDVSPSTTVAFSSTNPFDISRGTLGFVLSTSPNLDDYSNCYYIPSGGHFSFSISATYAEKKSIFPFMIDAVNGKKQFARFYGLKSNGSYLKEIVTGEKVQIPNGSYYQYMIISKSNDSKSYIIIKEKNNQKLRIHSTDLELVSFSDL